MTHSSPMDGAGNQPIAAPADRGHTQVLAVTVHRIGGEGYSLPRMGTTMR